jgi:hypothetical protein
MDYYHVIIKTVGTSSWEMLYADLSLSDLQNRFLKPYRRGRPFLATSRIIKPSELQSIRIIKTVDTEGEARDRINKADLADIAEMNRSSEIMIISPGIGHMPEHLAEAGEDVTGEMLNYGPGSLSSIFCASKKVVGWTLGIIAAVIAAAVTKWLGLT